MSATGVVVFSALVMRPVRLRQTQVLWVSVRSGLRRTSFSFHLQSVGSKATPRHCCTRLTCCCCWRWWQSRQVEFRAHFLFRNVPQVGLKLLPLGIQVVVYLPSIDNTEEASPAFNISGCSRVISICISFSGPDRAVNRMRRPDTYRQHPMPSKQSIY